MPVWRSTGNKTSPLKIIGVLTLMLPVMTTGYQSTANASPITYDLVGVSATFDDISGSFTNTFSGNFTFDPTTVTLSAADIIASGDLLVGEILPYKTPAFSFNNQINVFSFGFNEIALVFTTPLDSSPNSISSVVIFNVGLGFCESGADYCISSSAAGQVIPEATPVPAALPLFAGGLGAIGLLGWRRKRKNAAAIAIA